MEPYAQPIGLEAENAGCDRAGAPVARGVSFVMQPGEGMQLFGPNGSGKTSLLAMFAGLIRAAEGTIVWRNAGETSQKPFDDSVFFLGHAASVKASLTPQENLDFWAKTYGVQNRKARIDAALAEVGATSFAMMRSGRLSAGQRRRIDLARALIAARPVWLLDEPTAAIDRDGVAMVRVMTANHLARGGIAIIATHDDLGGGFKRMELGR